MRNSRRVGLLVRIATKGFGVRRSKFFDMAAIGSPVLLVLGVLAASAAPAPAPAPTGARATQPAPSGQAVLSQAQARALSSDVTDKVIVVFKNQVTGLPDTPAKATARLAAVDGLQRGVLSELTEVHARNVTSISLVNAVAATVSPGAARLLAANPAVAEVIPDSIVRAGSPPAGEP